MSTSTPTEDRPNNPYVGPRAFVRAETLYGKCDLRLMYPVNDVNSVPTAGKDLIIVANVNGCALLPHL